MRTILLFLTIALALSAHSVIGQRGGKAEPKEIKFGAGQSTARVVGILSSGKEANFLFKAQKGQEVTIRNPRWTMFDFRVYSEENFPDGDFDSSPSYTFEIPETGNYLFFVRKKMASPHAAKFSMTVTIK